MSNETTTTIGDTEVTITETEGGFEVVESEDSTDEPEQGLYIRASECDSGAIHGFEVPLDAEFEIKEDGSDYRATWFAEDNVSDMTGWTASPGHVGNRGAFVETPEIVVRE